MWRSESIPAFYSHLTFWHILEVLSECNFFPHDYQFQLWSGQCVEVTRPQSFLSTLAASLEPCNPSHHQGLFLKKHIFFFFLISFSLPDLHKVRIFFNESTYTISQVTSNNKFSLRWKDNSPEPRFCLLFCCYCSLWGCHLLAVGTHWGIQPLEQMVPLPGILCPGRAAVECT